MNWSTLFRKLPFGAITRKITLGTFARNLFLYNEFSELMNLLQTRVADPKTNPSASTNMLAIDARIKQLFRKTARRISSFIVGLSGVSLLSYGFINPKSVWQQFRDYLASYIETLKPGGVENTEGINSNFTGSFNDLIFKWFGLTRLQRMTIIHY